MLLFRNGSPRFQLNSAPELGASVATTLFAIQFVTSPFLCCDVKSRGSTGNILPPIWYASVCGWSQGRSGDALLLAAYAVETLDRMLFTTSCGPRRRELPVSIRAETSDLLRPAPA